MFDETGPTGDSGAGGGETKPGGPGPEGIKKESTFDQVYERWLEMNPPYDRSMVGTDEYKQVRREVVDGIESVYQKFLKEHGPVSGTNLKDYFSSFIGLVDFVSQPNAPHREFGFTNYELGYRFGIDALLNDEEGLSREERTAFRQYFMDRAPCYEHREFDSEERDRAFLKSYPRKEHFQVAVSLLCKKSQMLAYIRGARPPSSIQSNPVWRDLSSSQLDPVYQTTVKGRVDPHVMKYSSRDFLLDTLLYQIAGEDPSKYDEIRENSSFQVSDKEFLDKVRADFGVD